MHPYVATKLAQALVEDRIREADHRRPARELQRLARTRTAPAAAPERSRQSRLWNLVHLHQAYS